MILIALLASGCTDLPTQPAVVHDVVCPTGCVIPPGCVAVFAPPVGYRLDCTRRDVPCQGRAAVPHKAWACR